MPTHLIYTRDLRGGLSLQALNGTPGSAPFLDAGIAAKVVGVPIEIADGDRDKTLADLLVLYPAPIAVSVAAGGGGNDKPPASAASAAAAPEPRKIRPGDTVWVKAHAVQHLADGYWAVQLTELQGAVVSASAIRGDAP